MLDSLCSFIELIKFQKQSLHWDDQQFNLKGWIQLGKAHRGTFYRNSSSLHEQKRRHNQFHQIKDDQLYRSFKEDQLTGSQHNALLWDQRILYPLLW